MLHKFKLMDSKNIFPTASIHFIFTMRCANTLKIYFWDTFSTTFFCVVLSHTLSAFLSELFFFAGGLPFVYCVYISWSWWAAVVAALVFVTLFVTFDVCRPKFRCWLIPQSCWILSGVWVCMCDANNALRFGKISFINCLANPQESTTFSRIGECCTATTLPATPWYWNTAHTNLRTNTFC